MPARLGGDRGDLLVVGYAAVSQVELHVWHPTAGPLPRVVLLAGVLCLLARRRWPRAVPLACAAAGTAVSAGLAGDGTGVGIVTAVVAAGLLGRQGRRGVGALAVLVVMAVLGSAIDLRQRSDLVTAPALVLAAAGMSAVLYRASRQLDEVRSRIQQVQERGRAERAAMLTHERRRVARELHDVVSHHLTVAALQAGGARLQLASGGTPVGVAEALRAAEDAGRQALADLRPLLDVVGGRPALQPAPGLSDLPALVERVRAAGLDVAVHGSDLERLRVPAGHDLVAYRVLQEALTNAVRHGRQRVDVRVAVDGACLRVDVENDVGPARPASVPGHGLVGMRERLALYGGRLDAGRRGDRWSVRAELPLPVAADLVAT